jgi:phospholipid/cholesterol/gamma-HCH transport system substrate-binding protein
MGKEAGIMKRNVMREATMEMTVGAFLFLVLLVLSVFTIALSRENIFRKYHRYEVRFAEVIGIQDGDDVLLRGVPIGRITVVEVTPEGVLVKLALTRPLALREDYRVEILTTSMLGGKSLNVYEGSAAAGPLPPGTPITGTPPADLIDTATRVVQDVKISLEKEKILENLGATLENLRQVTDSLSRGEGTIGKLLVDETVYNDLQVTVANLKTATEPLAKGEGTLGRLLTDDGAVYEDIRAITANLKETTERLNSGEGMIGKLLSEDETVYNDLQASVASIRTITAKIESGEGTVGRLIMDPGLYDDASLLVSELRATLDDFRESSPVTTFTTVLFGAF